MRTTSYVLAAIAFMLAAPASAVVCPPPQPQPPGVGVGPAVQLAGIAGPRFDPVYAKLMYQQHSDVRALASWGADRVSDPNLSEFSRKIAGERVDMNQQLVRQFGQLCADR